MEYLLGIDIGTSACKIAAFDIQGNICYETSEPYPVFYPKPGHAEQRAEDWWTGVCTAVRRMFAESSIQAEEIAGVGVDGQSWAAVAIDGAGETLAPTPIWLDTRADEICRRVSRQIGEKEIFELAGNSLQAQYSTGKILWYKENMPQVFSHADKILQCNSYIVFRLSGVTTQDYSQGYGIHCFDVRRLRWDMDMCRALGIPEHMLPELFRCSDVVGRVTADAAVQTGLCQGTPVVAGGLDAACGALGVGVVRDGDTQEQGGQAGGMSILTEAFVSDPALILSAHVTSRGWLLQGGTTGGGGVIRWLEKELAGDERRQAAQRACSSLDVLNEACSGIPAGSGGLVFLPYMSGERSPIWDPSAKAVFYGLDFTKTKYHMIRAGMEGVAYSLRHNLEVAEAAGARVKILRAMGGSARSLLWTQIKADVTQKEIVVPGTSAASTLGAAILAGVGTGVYKSFEEAVEKTVSPGRRHMPNEKNRKVYDEGYKIYRSLYKNLKPIMNES